jgi:uroporphyrinogen decarboxylase
MTQTMNTHERMLKIYQHQDPDQVPITDWYWESTIERWKKEGLPANTDIAQYLHLDKFIELNNEIIDSSPQFTEYIIEETDQYRIERDRFGITKKNFKPVSATFQHLDHEVKDKASWEAAKKHMLPSKERINWDFIKYNYARWRKEGYWIIASPWFGYDIVNARMCNTETILYAIMDDPDWVIDMCNTGCNLSLGLLQMIIDEGYDFDELMWFDDMAYRGGLLFSKKVWRQILRPYQKKVVDWAHSHGKKVHLHSCGNMVTLLPELLELGIDMLNPMEVKAGVDPVAVKKQFGSQLVLRGGFDVQNWSQPEKVEQDIRTKLPALMESGGYVFASDHSVADNVSLDDYHRIVDLVREVGKY